MVTTKLLFSWLVEVLGLIMNIHISHNKKWIDCFTIESSNFSVILNKWVTDGVKLQIIKPQQFVRSETEHLVFELADGTSLGVAKRLGSLLHGADHGRRATHEDLDIVGRGRETFLKLSVCRAAV